MLSLVKRLSLKLWKKISLKFSGGFSFSGILRKFLLFLFLMELIEGIYVFNFDFGISLCVENLLKSRIVFVFGNIDLRLGNFNLLIFLGGFVLIRVN